MAMLEATKAKDTFGDTLNRAAYGKERIILTRRGKPIAALVPLEDIELLNELENQADAAEVRLAREEAARGEVVAWDPELLAGAQERDPEQVARVRSVRGKFARSAGSLASEALHQERQADKKKEERAIFGHGQ